MPPDPVRILQVTDPHLYAEADGSLRGTVTADSLNAVVDHIRRQEWPADFVVSTGDIVQDDSASAYARFKDLMAPIGLPVHCIPGNHDVPALMQAALSGGPWHYCEAFVVSDWQIIGIDSYLKGHAGGKVSNEELSRLRQTLANTNALHAAVFLHHPPLKMGSRWLDSVGLHNAQEFLDLITTAGNVRIVIFGHVHQAFEEMYESIRIIGTPSTCAQFKPREVKFQLDDSPPAYRRISLGPDGSIDTELVWLDMGE
ncbi:MAG: 3',5'-cyclic-AMP phosphodiesterase [Woeseiaceae bacterium]|nr:3',5'-cyclic-AMP phosphodiesterase [Woeseiaceae bacterium]